MSLAKVQLVTAGHNAPSAIFVAIALLWVAGFVLYHKQEILYQSVVPLIFLLLIVLTPAHIVQIALQNASAEITHALFGIIGVPVFRQGLTFSLPGVDIEIARECSGIRSSVSLIVAAVLASHLFMPSSWRKALFVIITVAVVIFKNAVRIVTLSYFGIYVDERYLQGGLHHQYGGLVFSLLALALLTPAFLMLWDENSVRCKQK